MFKKKIKCEAFVSNISSIWKVFMVTRSFLIFGSLLTWNIRITIKKITILVKGLTLFYVDIKNVKHTHFRYYFPNLQTWFYPLYRPSGNSEISNSTKKYKYMPVLCCKVVSTNLAHLSFFSQNNQIS